MNRLSVTIITLNEEKFIGKCIESVIGIADEIVVVDSGSSDKTVEVAERLGANVYMRKFDNYASQKNFAVSKTNGEWVLSLDADEVLEDELLKEIRVAIKSNDYNAYSIPRKNIIFGNFIRYTRWQPELDRHVWLFRRTECSWVGKVHEEVEVKGKVGKLRSAKVHYQYKTVTEFLEMMNRYTTLESRDRFEKGERFSVFNLVFTSFYHFLVRYLYRLGFLDGWRGFVLSYLMAIYYIEVLVKLWELPRNNDQ